MRQIRNFAIATLAASTLGACATKGFVRRGLDEQRVAMTQEQLARANGDSTLRTDVNGVRTDVASVRADIAALRTELSTLRTEFGAKISMIEGQITFALPVHFGFDAAAVRQQDEAALTKFAQVAGAHYKGAMITIEGFADPAGSAQYNVQLSQKRADAVREYLVGKGLNNTNLKTVGYGKARLVRVGAKRNAPGAELNRRVTFVIDAPSETTVAALSLRQP